MSETGALAFERALAFVRARSVLKRGERVLVASGGGAASVGLLAFVWMARDALKLRSIAVLSIDGGALDDGDRSADAARAARALGLDVRVVEADGLAVSQRIVREIRDRRYDVAAVGHTVEDAAARALRELLGAGPIRGLAARRRDGLRRPLLDTTAAEADALTRLAGLDPPTCEPGRGWTGSFALDRAVREALLPRVRALGPDVERSLAGLVRRVRAQ